jgi:acid phosphatase (class A)
MFRSSLLVLSFLVCAGAYAETPAPPQASRLGVGYLPLDAMPDARLLVPPPPAPGSAAEARDVEASKAALAMHGGPRWALAMRDADIFSPGATGTMSCAAGFEISPTATPKLEALLRKSMANLAMSTAVVKRLYQRQRPFVVNGQPQCTPEWDAVLRKDGAYPSGHAAIGYGWGLILAELVPDRAAQLVARGRAFADSRRVCNVHWLSDTEEGMVVATAAVARLRADPGFQRDLKAARREVQSIAVKSRTPTTDCNAEAAALALR